MRTLSDGRQRRTRQEWHEIVAHFERSGLSENRFCKEQRLTRKTFRTWRQRFAEEAARPADFVELAVPELEPSSDQRFPSAFELCLPGGVTLRWSA